MTDHIVEATKIVAATPDLAAIEAKDVAGVLALYLPGNSMAACRKAAVDLVDRLSNIGVVLVERDHIARLTAERDALSTNLDELVAAVNGLIDDSEGVYGLHLNGDPAPWDDLTLGGRYQEWLLPLAAAEHCLSVVPAEHANEANQRATKAEAERDAAVADRDALRDALAPIVDEFGCSIELYHRNGPHWTHKDGTQVFDVSVLLDREPLLDAAKAALTRTAGADHA